MIYSLTADITHTSSKSEIKQFAEEHGCTLLKFKALENSNHLVTFSSNNLDYIQELTDQLQLSHSRIVSL
tara:strand:- start:887 stop:1096 length:210 start_codon:yes stop_codon:yes gene_type:complete